MIPGIGSSVSGIRAAFKMLDSSAHNTANADTNGFKKYKVHLKEGEDGGVVATVSKSAGPGPVYTDAEGNQAEGSNTDYTEEMSSLIIARYLAKTNMAVFKTADEMNRHVLDIKA